MLWDSFFTATQPRTRCEMPLDFLCAGGGGLDLEVLLCTCAAVVVQWREVLLQCSTFSSAILIAQVSYGCSGFALIEYYRSSAMTVELFLPAMFLSTVLTRFPFLSHHSCKPGLT